MTARRIAFAGLLSLAVAMGIGRFAFTPLLPLMVRDGQLDIAGGGWIAAANYAGYLVGALTAARVRLGAGALGIVALVATAVLTALMALPSLPLWGVLRFLAGVASAWAFVATSVWCLGALAQQGRSALGSMAYAGVGAGIALAGLYCLFAAALGTSAQALWLQLGALALVLALPAIAAARRLGAVAAAAPAAVAAAAPGAELAGTRGLVLCYGLMGFGYILPATFLPVLARSVVDDPRWFGLAWPVFGITAAISTLLAGAWMRRSSRLSVWTTCQFLMGVGVLLPSLWLTGVAIALSALLVGGTFMVITLAGVQEMRERAGGNPTALVGRLTAAFAAGQIAGPVLSSMLLHLPGFATHGLGAALQIGATGLFASAAWLWRQARPSPLHRNPELPHAR